MHNTRIELVQADITTLDVDMIVNAANASLCGGGGVDGAIHRAAGPELLAHCRTLGGAATGDVVVTDGYGLRARYIAHAVGPVWRGGDSDEAVHLRQCYARALEHAARLGLSSLAFPSISTGAFRHPIDDAARIAVDTVVRHLSDTELPRRVVFALFSARDLAVYRRALSAVAGP